MMKKRNVLLHYHIFKNAGTTFERVLDENYGDRHMTFDGPFSFSSCALFSEFSGNPRCFCEAPPASHSLGLSLQSAGSSAKQFGHNLRTARRLRSLVRIDARGGQESTPSL